MEKSSSFTYRKLEKRIKGRALGSREKVICAKKIIVGQDSASREQFKEQYVVEMGKSHARQ